MPRKKKQKNINESESEVVSQPANGSEKDSKNKKADPDKQHRRKTIAFVLIVIVLLGIIASMVASQLLPEYKILAMPRKAVAMVMAPVQKYFSSGTNWLVNYVQRLKLRSNIEYEYEQLYEKYDDLLSQVIILICIVNSYLFIILFKFFYEKQCIIHYQAVHIRIIKSISGTYFHSIIC